MLRPELSSLSIPEKVLESRQLLASPLAVRPDLLVVAGESKLSYEWACARSARLSGTTEIKAAGENVCPLVCPLQSSIQTGAVYQVSTGAACKAH
jgi:hypothetical protein